jgi:hypothetical protein
MALFCGAFLCGAYSPFFNLSLYSFIRAPPLFSLLSQLLLTPFFFPLNLRESFRLNAPSGASE